MPDRGAAYPDRERFIMSDPQPVTPEAPEAPATPEPPKPAPPAADKAADKDWAAEAEKWKALARKHEDQSKANADKARRFDEFEESQKTEQQKLEEAATAARTDAAQARAEAAVLKAAIDHGLGKDDLELLGTHGTPEEIATRAERLAARLNGPKPKPDFGGGDRGGDVSQKASQLSREDLKRMSPQEIDAAREAGRLESLLTGK